MKAIMYHYVRTFDPALPNQRYLHRDDFVAQLDWFGREFGFVERTDFDEAIETGRPARGVVLTFDDALADHAEVVWPILVERGLWGIFYVPTGPYRTGRMLSVHRLHHLLDTHGGRCLLDSLAAVLDDDMLAHGHVDEFRTATYGRLDDDAAIDEFKRTLNYFIAAEHRDPVLDTLDSTLGVDSAAVSASYYAPPDALRAMHASGMVIGSHSDAHSVLSTLDETAQRRDIERSFTWLSDLLGADIETYCHPFGGFHTFDESTERILMECGARYAFNVESRDIATSDLVERPTALPRYDCNEFLHGRAHIGSTPPGGCR